MTAEQDIIADVIVVGAGNAAVAAAISAREAGARVVVLEKAPKAERGGNTKYTELYRFTYNGLEDLRELIPQLSDEEAESLDILPYTTDQFYNDIMYITGGRADPEFTQAMADESHETVKWLVGMGVKWEIATELARMCADGKLRFMPGMASRPSGGGMDVLRTLYGVMEQRGIPILYETQALRLLTNERGRVCGVRVRDREGQRDVRSKAVVLGSGGFQASPEMRARYLGPGWDLVKVRGTRYNTGDGLQMALEIGAATTGHISGCHACQVFLEGPDYEMGDLAWAHGFPNGIMVNVLGKRFVDEGEDYLALTYARMGKEVFQQPKGIAFQIFDSKVTSILFNLLRYRSVTQPAQANTIEELARQLDIDEESLVATVRAFNAAVQEGEYSAGELDGKSTKGLSPNKTNWALKIDTPPFLAYPVTCGVTFTFGGVKTNTRAQVLDTVANPIPCLYAVGEVVGSFYFNYAGGSGLTKGAVFGRIAGNNSAAEPV